MRSEITQLEKAAKEFGKKVEDIIVFGSVMRGKKEPKDIDIMIVFKDRMDKDVEYEFKKKLKDLNIALISKTVKSWKEESFSARDAIMFEGYSLISKELMADSVGFRPIGIFKYDTKPLSNTKKTRFYYALNGRGESKGLSLDMIKLSDNMIGVKLDEIELFKEFLEFWEIEYRYIPTLIPKRLAKKKILEIVR